MEQQYRMERRLLRSAFVLFLLTAVLVLLALFRVDARGLRITLLILSVLPFAVGLWLLFLIRVSHVAAREKRNFFLYDPRRRANRELSELSSEEVLERGFRYMSMFRRGRQFYIASLFDEEGVPPRCSSRCSVICCSSC